MTNINFKHLNWYIFILIAWTMIPLINGAFGVEDDFLFYKEYHLTNYWKESFESAKDQGRVFESFIMPVFFKMLPYFSGNLFVASTINILLFAIDFILLSYFLSRVIGDKFLKYFILIFLVITVSIHGHYNPLVSYPIYFSFSIMLMLLSFIFINKYQTSLSKRDLTFSVACYLFSLLFCEMHIFYLLIIIAINNDYKFKLNINSIKNNRNFYFILVTGIYVVIYVLWGILFSSNEYKGNRIDADLSIMKIFSTILSFSKSSAPLYFFFLDRELFIQNSYLESGHSQNLLYAIVHAKLEWLIRGLTVSAVVYFVLQKIQVVNLHKILKVLLISFVFIFIPNVLISITPKYIEWGAWENYYVYTFYSYLSIVVLVSMILILPLTVIKNAGRSIYIVVLSVLFFIVTVINSYINYHAVVAIKKSEKNLEAIRLFVKTEAFNSLKENVSILTPDLFEKPSDALYFSWSKESLNEYVKIHSGKNILFVDSIEKAGKGPLYYLGYSYNNKSGEEYLTFSPITYLKKDTIRANEIILFVNSVNKKYTISLNKESNKPFLINDSILTNANHLLINMEQMNKKMNMVPVTIRSENIDLNSFIYSTMNNNKGIKFEF